MQKNLSMAMVKLALLLCSTTPAVLALPQVMPNPLEVAPLEFVTPTSTAAGSTITSYTTRTYVSLFPVGI